MVSPEHTVGGSHNPTTGHGPLKVSLRDISRKKKKKILSFSFLFFREVVRKHASAVHWAIQEDLSQEDRLARLLVLLQGLRTVIREFHLELDKAPHGEESFSKRDFRVTVQEGEHLLLRNLLLQPWIRVRLAWYNYPD